MEVTSKTNYLVAVFILSSFALEIQTVSIARAGTTFYIGPNNGTWSNGTNWDAGVQPTTGDDVIVGQFVPSRLGDVNITFDGNYPDYNHALNSLTLDATGATGSIIINQSSNGSSMCALTEYIGTAGHNAIYNQSGGINQFGNGSTSDYIYLGFDAGSTGSYFISNTASLASTSGLFAGWLYVGYSGNGVVSQSGGTVNVSRLRLAENPGSKGTYTLTGGTLATQGINSDPAEIIGNGDSASFSQSGGTHTAGDFTSGYVGIGAGSTYSLSGGSFTLKRGSGDADPAGGHLVNEGTFNLSGGVLTLNWTGASLNNYDGTFNYSGGLVSLPDGGTIDNSGTFNINVPVATISGTIVNSSIFNVTGSVISFASTFTNNGTYISTSPSIQDFTTLNIGSVAYIQGGVGDIFNVGRDLTNNSSQNSNFDLTAARLILSGNGISHRVAWPGADVGAVSAGYTNNFAVGVLQLTSGGSLALLDGNGTAGGAIYTEVLLLEDGVSQITNISTSGSMSIYYDPNNSANGYLQGNTYPLNGGGVIAPVPSQTPLATPPATPSHYGNVSTRLSVGTGDNVGIGGFIIQGPQAKKVVVRGIGPSLTQFGVAGALANPTLELHDHTGATISSNDDWKDTQQADIQASGLAPSNDLESAIIATLDPGAYTAILSGKNNTSGVGLVEIYDLDSNTVSKLANISTRGLVQTGDNVMIAGLISVASPGVKTLVRAIGPSLSQFGIPNALADPVLELHNSNGATIATDDNWKDTQQADIQASGLAPSNDAESAILATLSPGAYTAIVRGKNSTSGVALVEAYQLSN
jgi:hypothetical protein